MRANKFLKLSIWLVFWLMFLPACLPVNKQPYAQKKYYRQTKAAIAQLPAPVLPTLDTLQVGWAKENITPDKSAPLAGYGKRKGQHYASIHDSIYVRAFVFKNSTRKAAFITLDLLITPMAVTAALQQQLPNIGFMPSQVYLTATHAHNSVGGWARKPAGYLMAGKYDKKMVDRLTQAIIRAIKRAENAAAPAQMGFSIRQAPTLVRNRLLGEAGAEDAGVRVLKIYKPRTRETAVLCTFAAHATCLPAAEHALSGDYPTALVQELEKDPAIHFAAFGAGAVGSHSPAAPGENFTKITNMASGLAVAIQNTLRTMPVSYQFNLNSISVPLYLRKPHWRISQNWRLHPALFYLIFGKYPATLTGLRIGNLVFVGTPCDFSGELVPDLEKHLKSVQDRLIITSFNGGYIGYITPDKYYNLKKYETRDMNLFGPYNGAYLSEMIILLLNKL